MKKTIKSTLVISLSIIMLLLSTIPAFSATISHIENHSYIDCIGQYKDEYNGLNYIIKIPEGTDLNCITVFHELVFITDNMDNDIYAECLGDPVMNDVNFMKTYDGYDYYHYYCGASNADSMGIKLYYDYGRKHYMATGAVNGSTTEGSGYWLYV